MVGSLSSPEYRERATKKYGPRILEALDTRSPLHERVVLTPSVDLSYPMVYYVVRGLQDYGLVVKVGPMVYLTERGKIAIALIRGSIRKYESYRSTL